MKNLLIALLNFYQTYLSFDRGVLAIFAPGGACKYQVRCSEYTREMVIRHGAVKGLILGFKRIWSCR